MKWLEKFTIYFAHYAFPAKENSIIAALKGRLEVQLKPLENELKAIRPDMNGRTWRITYHPIYRPMAPRTLGNQASLMTVIAFHTEAENRALADLMRSGRPITWRGHKRSDIMSRAFSLNVHPARQRQDAPALILDHEKIVDGRLSREEGHGVHVFIAKLEAHVRDVSNIVAWQGFSYDAKRALLLATGQTRARRFGI